MGIDSKDDEVSNNLNSGQQQLKPLNMHEVRVSKLETDSVSTPNMIDYQK